MDKAFEKLIYSWPKPYIRDQDIVPIFLGDDGRRYDSVKYAIKKGVLCKVRRGLYLIQLPHQKVQYEPFEIAQAIYGPSYISLESALSFHGWIPEKVIAVTSVSSKVGKKFITPLGPYYFSRIPLQSFLLGVSRIEDENGAFLMATPWKAIADFIYVRHKKWSSINQMIDDLRIDALLDTDVDALEEIAKRYSSARVRAALKHYWKEIVSGHKDYR